MAERLPIDATQPEPERIAQVCAVLNAHGVVGLPTDTVYGLAANPWDLAAVEQVYRVKGRAHDKPLLLLVAGIGQVEELAGRLDPLFYKLAAAFWPGPLTLIVEAGARLPLKVTAQTGHVALRQPRAPIAMAVIRAAGHPLTATSANRSGEPECLSAFEVERQLGEHLPLIVDGGPAASPLLSSLVDLTCQPPRLLREGAIAAAALQPFLAGVC